MTPDLLNNFTVPSDLDECQRMLTEVVETLKTALGRLDEKNGQIQELEQRLQLLLRAKYGRLSESIASGQLRLFERSESDPAPAADESAAVKSEARRSKHGRRRPAKELPRRRVVHELPEEERCCARCGAERKPIGEEVSERYGYVPACVEVIEDVRVKYACSNCDEPPVVAAVPAKPIPKGLADGSMIAYIATSKYADHLPLNRLEGIFLRHGAEIARSTMCDWLAAAADLLVPLYERLKERVLGSRIIWTDDTPVDLQDRNHEANMREARTWVYIGDMANHFTVFDFTDSRKRDGPANFLKDFKGFLQADAYAGYDRIYAGDKVREVACWAHVRRKFYEALNSNKRAASKGLRHIQLLYRIEKRYASRSFDARRAIRQSRSRRVLTIFKRWLDTEVVIERKGPLAKAIRYALNNWDALCTFLEDGELTLDNNKSERALRSVAVGRKNWLFVGSRDGGRRAAILCSLIASCKQYGIDPLAYLTDVLNRLGRSTEADINVLLPDKWSPAA